MPFLYLRTPRTREFMGAHRRTMMQDTAQTAPAYERIDLHTHSRHSDGALSPVELVALAAERNVQLLALTDHDTLAGCAAAAQACVEARIDFLYGSELTALWRGREIHVVGLRLDPDCVPLNAHLQGVRELRIERVRRIGAKLTREGLAGDEIVAEVLSLPGTPTRLHLAQRLVARAHAKDVDDAFKRWLGTGKRAAVPAEWPGVDEAVKVIAAAGGLAVLAHPHRYTLSSGALSELCGQFRQAGGAGIEVSLPGLSPKDAARAASLARRFDLAGSCASDFHAPGLPWRPLGRFAKLPEGVVPLLERLGMAPAGAIPTTTHAPTAP